MGPFLGSNIRIELVRSVGGFTGDDGYFSMAGQHGLLALLISTVLTVVLFIGNAKILSCGATVINSSVLWWKILFIGFFLLSVPASGGAGWVFYPPLSSGFTEGYFIIIILCTVIFNYIASAGWYVFSKKSSEFRQVSTTAVQNASMVLSAEIGVIWITCSAAPLLFVVLSKENDLELSFVPYAPVGAYENSFWGFGHPIVYFTTVPLFTGLACLMRHLNKKNLIKYLKIEVVEVSKYIFAISFIVWGHHLFTSTQSVSSSIFFTFSSLFVVAPMVGSWSWLVRAQDKYSTFYKYGVNSGSRFNQLGALLFFFIGGVTGLFLVFQRTNEYFHDSFFVVGHFHAFWVPFGVGGWIVLWRRSLFFFRGEGLCFSTSGGLLVTLVSFVFFMLVRLGGLPHNRRSELFVDTESLLVNMVAATLLTVLGLTIKVVFCKAPVGCL